MFDAGHQIRDVWSVVSKRNERWGGIGRWTVCDLRNEWLAAHRKAATRQAPAPKPAEQLELAEVMPAASEAEDAPVGTAQQPAEQPPVGSKSGEQADDAAGAEAAPLVSGRHVQHVGGWLLVAMVHALGLHDAVQQGWQAPGRWGHRLRMALNAVVLALGLRQRCVEGVRRLRTPSAGVLLRSEGAPTANWTRRIFKHYLRADALSGAGDAPPEGRGAAAQMRMIELYLAQARRDAQTPAVF